MQIMHIFYENGISKKNITYLIWNYEKNYKNQSEEFFLHGNGINAKKKNLASWLNTQIYIWSPGCLRVKKNMKITIIIALLKNSENKLPTYVILIKFTFSNCLNFGPTYQFCRPKSSWFMHEIHFICWDFFNVVCPTKIKHPNYFICM